MRIVIIGSGNTATVLGRLCHRQHHEVVQVFGRNSHTVEDLAVGLEAQPVLGDWDLLRRDADLYLVALPDRILPGLHQYFKVQKGLVVHTAGSVPMEVLQEICPNYGVIYPLQSLRAEVLHYSNIPLLVDGNTAENKTLIADFAATLSPMVSYADNEQRLHLHHAAVWVNNFPNFLFTIAWEICREHQVDFRLLLPLMEHTVGRLHQFTPAEMQTGPALRGDQETINRHLSLLDTHPLARKIYQMMSNAIAAQLGGKAVK